MKLSVAEINYLSAILRLGKGNTVATSQLAEAFNIAPASVTEMVQKLAEKEYVHYEKYKGVHLRPLGERIAKQASNTSSIWLKFLENHLPLPKAELTKAVNQLSEIQNEELIKAIRNFNDNPTPTIKSVQTSISQPFNNHRLSSPLIEANKHEEYVICGVDALSKDAVELLDVLNLSIGERVIIQQQFSFDNSLQLKVGQQQLIISEKLANMILVQRYSDLPSQKK